VRRSDGFTLLEMLIVIGITALLVTAAVQAHLGIRRAQTRAAQGLHRERAAEVLLDRLERELVGTVLVVRPTEVDRLSHPYVFYGEDYFVSDADADAVRFVTRNPLRAAPGHTGSGVRLVTYNTRTSDVAGITLVREEKPLPENLQKEPVIEEGQEVLDEVALFRLRYLDDEGEDWREDWDSTDVALLDRLPTAVEITVALLEEDELGERSPGPEHPRVVPLPVRPFDLAALQGLDVEGGGASDPNAPEEGEDSDDTPYATVRDCANQLTAAGVSLDQDFRNLVAQYGSQQYSPRKHDWMAEVLANYGVSCRLE
jgi:type II secretion system protein J